MLYPNFIDNRSFLALNSDTSELDQAIAIAENIKKIHALTTTNFDTFDELIEVYLKTGIQIFDMEIGIVSQIENNEYTICNAVSPDNSLNKGDLFELGGTYCREVYKSKQVLGFPHVGSMEEFKDHPVYVNMKLEAYLSAPIFVNNEIFGTLNFTSTQKRIHGFSQHERDLISLMANSIGNFLLAQERKESLIYNNKRLKRLMGYVAHDLRSPIGNIVSLTSFIPDSDQKEREDLCLRITENAERSLEMIHTILEVAAIGTGKITLQKEPFNISKLAMATLKEFSPQFDHKKIKLVNDIDSNLSALIDKMRFKQVFHNLFSNAAKYSLNQGSIWIKLQKQDKQIVFTLKNQFDSKQIASAKEDLARSVGFGLEISREILKLHQSELEDWIDQDCYHIRFFLPLS